MQRLVYEGSDPERLLHDVWEKHGASVRITEPIETRQGGVFGFFSKVVYRIEVEPVVADPDTPAQGSVASPPLTADRVDSGPPVARPEEPDAADMGRAATLSRLADSTVDVLELGASTPTPSFDAVLDGVASSLGEPPGTYRPGHVLPRVTLGNLLTEVDQPAVDQAAVDQARTDPSGWQPGLTDHTGDPLTDHTAGRFTDHTAGRFTDPPAERFTVVTRPGPRPPGPGTSARRLATVLDLLCGAGFPEHLLPGMERLAAPDFTVEEAFASLAPAPNLPTVTGSLIAVVGEGHEARAAVRDLAVELGLDPEEVAVAAPWRAARGLAPDLFVRTPEEAAALSPGWRRDRVGLVAVNAPLLSCDHEWAKAMLRALRPSITLGQHLATTKPEDVARWARLIGGLDALLVEQIERTATPAATLAAGIPVSRLDGFPATAQRWAQITTNLVATR